MIADWEGINGCHVLRRLWRVRTALLRVVNERREALMLLFRRMDARCKGHDRPIDAHRLMDLIDCHRVSDHVQEEAAFG